MKVLVCGSRNWSAIAPIEARLMELPSDTLIIHGAARGADTIAGSIAIKLKLDVETYPAHWGQYGKGAGPIRNRVMLDQRPDLVIAFCLDYATSKGTKDCIDEAVRRGIPTEIISPAGLPTQAVPEIRA